MSLWSDFLTNDARLIHKWKHYFPIYERHFQHWVNRPLVFLEIGCGFGGSLQMWKRYFGPHAHIIGIDILPRCKEYEEDQIAVRIGPQQDVSFLQGVIDEFGAPDIVLDDGSHMMSHLAATFDFLFPRIARNGVYVVEDLHTAYWDEYEGGLRKPTTFIELCKNLIDELNADHSRGTLEPTEFTRTTLSMHFYDSVVVFEKGAHTKKWAPQIGHREYVVPESKSGVVAPRQQLCAETGRDSVAKLQANLADALSQRNEAQEALRRSRNALAASDDTLNRMRSSVSWRVTEPARRFMTAFRSRPREGGAPHQKKA